MGFKGHRWRNSFYTIQIRAISPYIQAKMIGHVVNLVNNTLISIYWSGSCAIYLFILKSGDFFFNWRTSFYVPAKIAPFSFSARGAILWVFWFLSWAIYFYLSVYIYICTHIILDVSNSRLAYIAPGFFLVGVVHVFALHSSSFFYPDYASFFYRMFTCWFEITYIYIYIYVYRYIHLHTNIFAFIHRYMFTIYIYIYISYKQYLQYIYIYIQYLLTIYIYIFIYCIHIYIYTICIYKIYNIYIYIYKVYNLNNIYIYTTCNIYKIYNIYSIHNICKIFNICNINEHSLHMYIYFDLFRHKYVWSVYST